MARAAIVSMDSTVVTTGHFTHFRGDVCQPGSHVNWVN
jgi:hypothetical protein